MAVPYTNRKPHHVTVIDAVKCACDRFKRTHAREDDEWHDVSALLGYIDETAYLPEEVLYIRDSLTTIHEQWKSKNEYLAARIERSIEQLARSRPGCVTR